MAKVALSTSACPWWMDAVPQPATRSFAASVLKVTDSACRHSSTTAESGPPSPPTAARTRAATRTKDHLHIELTRHAASRMNLATFRAVVGGTPREGRGFGRDARGDQVRQWQQLLNYARAAGLDSDGVFGPATEAATKAFQQERQLNSASHGG
jgi:hypothetical protein